ncbi:MAG: hypothetical protein JO206_06055 [Solirubrobacterales bacterium]|nr:hypothetical protein [Solirubrobacterales bacterium]MBV9472513.1 hypothetical protein [Solirubrobacterales bacterium]
MRGASNRCVPEVAGTSHDPIDSDEMTQIHLDAAIQLRKRGSVDAVLTYDRQLQAGCAHHGLPIEAPVLS